MAPKAGRRLIGESRAMALTETFCTLTVGWKAMGGLAYPAGTPTIANCMESKAERANNGSPRLRLRYLGRGGRRFLVLQTLTLANRNADD